MSCLDCGYYDKEKHHCPFYCELIRETLNEAIAFELSEVKEEIMSVYKEETKEDTKWATGLKYSTKIIDKHISNLKGE